MIEVIETCQTPEQLNEREKFWICVLNSKIPYGYNRSVGGGNGERKTLETAAITVTIAEGLKRFRKNAKLRQEDIAALSEFIDKLIRDTNLEKDCR